MQSLSFRLPTDKRIIYSLVCAAFLLQSCASFRGPGYKLAAEDSKTFSEPLREAKEIGKDKEQPDNAQKSSSSTGLSITAPPKLKVLEASKVAEEKFIPELADSLILRQSYNDMPVPAFINEVFGNQLSLNFQLQPSIKQVPDLVTLRLNEKLTQKDLYQIANRTLAGYGVTTFERNGVLVFDFSAAAAKDEVPLIMTGQALPEVPPSSRPIFYVYPLTALKTPAVRPLLRDLFPKNQLDVSEDLTRNALVLSGKPQKVKEAVAAIRLLDRPTMSDLTSRIIRPSVNTATELTDSLFKILKAEGFVVDNGDGNSPVRLLPIESTGQVIVFAKSKEVLQYVLEWAERLEEKRTNSEEEGLFSYQVQSTKALHIVSLLSDLGLADGIESDSSGTGAAQPTSNRNNSSRDDSKGRYAVDEMLNTILFSGTGKEWSKALGLIKKLDKPAPSVMVEIILAEVSLEESEESAIEWILNSSIGAYDLASSTIGALGESGGGLSFNLTNSANATRAALNFLYKNSRTTIRSRPRVMVKSGESASIEVGDRVPILNNSVQSTASADAAIVQSVSYQETGVLLDIKPTVHATGFVDIEISQELSEAVDNESSSINSPTIRSRSLETSLALRDGGSVLIGGLIRSNNGEGETGVPILGKLPVMGKLFRGDTMSQTRTELMIMIIPYILNSPDEAESLNDAFQEERMRIIESSL